MRFNHRKIPVILIFLIIASLFLISSVSAAESVPPIPTAGNTSPSKMEVGTYVNAINNFDFIKGTYSMDFYLHFRWTDPTIKTAAEFQLMNGRISSGSYSVRQLMADTSGPVKEEWYRVRADFDVTPNIRNYPFESGTVPIVIENGNLDQTRLIFVPLVNESGIDPQFVIPGWTIGTPVFTVTDHLYPWGKTYSRVFFNVPVTKNPMDSIIQTLLPPVLFCLIAMLSFFINLEHRELLPLRYGLTTSMFITAVMYHFSQLSMLPGLGVLKLFDKFMIAVYIFLAATIVVTTLCYLAQRSWERPELVKPINLYGMVVSILLPFISFWLLVTLM
ncbi:MAG: hypothetical protein Q7T80_03590 [Methanoregula sp.]|nr:hypothetical protein [Methanoregula sp.]